MVRWASEILLWSSPDYKQCLHCSKWCACWESTVLLRATENCTGPLDNWILIFSCPGILWRYTKCCKLGFLVSSILCPVYKIVGDFCLRHLISVLTEMEHLVIWIYQKQNAVIQNWPETIVNHLKNIRPGFPGWHQSNCLVKPIFAQSYPIVGWKNIDYILSL